MKAHLISNPAAGRQDRRNEVLSVCRSLLNLGWSVELHRTERAGDATRLAKNAVDAGCNVVIAAGGDGTVNEVINGVAGSPAALGILPTGSTNVWATEVGIPLKNNLVEAGRILATGKIVKVDLGQAGRRYFILAAGLGLDGLVISRINLDKKRLFGNMHYIATALSLARSFRGTRATIKIDGNTYLEEVLWILVSNSRLYGGLLRIARKARVDDGLLDVVVLKGQTLRESPHGFLYLLSQGKLGSSKVDYYQGHEVEIAAQPPFAVHVDAEYIGETPLMFRCVPQCLRVIAPADYAMSHDAIQC